MKSIYSGLILTLALTLTSCSSLKDKAEDHLEKGNYKQARLTLIEAIKKDKDDAELHQLKRIADNGYIKELLIALRNRNLENHYEQSITLAHEIYQIRKEGDVEENADGSSLEAKEVRKTFKHYKTQIQNYLKNNHVIKAKKYYKDHFILYEAFFGSNLLKLGQTVDVKGQEKCSSLYKTAKKQSLYFKQFTNSYCALFQSQKRHTIPAVDPQLFSGIEVKLNLKNKVDEGALNDKIKDSIHKKFKNTVWFNVNAPKVAKAQISGAVEHALSTREKVRIHEYTVEVPYTDYEMVKKRRTEFYTENETLCTPAKNGSGHFCSSTSTADPNCNCTERPVTKSREVEYEEKEPVTRYREEARTYRYPSEEVTFMGKIKLSGNLLLSQKKIPFFYNDKSYETWHYSKVNRPKIGLRSINPHPNYPFEWEKQQVYGLTTKIEKAFNTSWQEKYCKSKITRSNYMKRAGSVFACVKYEGTQSPTLAKWLKEFADMSYSDFSQILTI